MKGRGPMLPFAERPAADGGWRDLAYASHVEARDGAVSVMDAQFDAFCKEVAKCLSEGIDRGRAFSRLYGLNLHFDVEVVLDALWPG